jgi:hypothetical protein
VAIRSRSAPRCAGAATNSSNALIPRDCARTPSSALRRLSVFSPPTDGDIGRLCQAIELAAKDWRDVLMAAGLADTDWPRRLDEELGRAGAWVWLPERHRWVDADGTEWTRSKPRWLTERAAKPLALRNSVVLGVEHVCGPVTVEQLDYAVRRNYWDRYVAGHIDDGAGCVDPNSDGLTYRVSTWSDPQGGRLVLLSEMC